MGAQEYLNLDIRSGSAELHINSSPLECPWKTSVAKEINSDAASRVFRA